MLAELALECVLFLAELVVDCMCELFSRSAADGHER